MVTVSSTLSQAMTDSLETLAVEAALASRWEEALKLNLEITHKDSENVEAFLRLGRAHLALKNIQKAEDAFKKALKLDSLNQVATKNLEALKKGRNHAKEVSKERGFLIDPATTKKVIAHLNSRMINPKSLLQGDKLTLELKNNQILVLDNKGRVVGMVCENDCQEFAVAKKIYKLRTLEASFVSVSKGTLVELLARANLPVFKGEKQDISPDARFQTVDEESGK